MRTLLGYLAQFASFTNQGELLCTQALAFLLQDPDARSAFAAGVGKRTEYALGADLAWRSEALQAHDNMRPDLEACGADDKAVVKVEAKLGAPLWGSQLRSYVEDLHRQSGSGVLMVLVPQYRAQEATQTIIDEFDVSGPGPWRPDEHPGVAIAVITWHEVLHVLDQVGSDHFRHHLAEYREMYMVLNGYDILPLADTEAIRAWREHEGVFVDLVDVVTRRLNKWPRLGPMGVESVERQPEGLEPKGYRRRYVGLPLGASEPCFSIGVRDPFEGHGTPIWMRFHCETSQFALIRRRLESSDIASMIVSCCGHAWIPLEVPVQADGEQMVTSLIAQANDVIDVAYQPPH